MAETKRLPFLGRRRAKVKKSPTEWIETLVPVEPEGAEAPADAASEFPAGDLPPAEPSYEPTTPAYVPPSERAPGLPDERTLQSLRTGYVARSPMNIDQIHSYIDDHLASKRLPPPMRPRRAPPPTTPIAKRGRPVKIVGVPVSGDVVDQKIVYETAGGYVLEVSEKTADGQVERTYYTISKVDHVGHALDALRAGGRLETRPTFDSGVTPAPSFEEAKRAVEAASPPPPGEAAPAPMVDLPEPEREPVHRGRREHEPEPTEPAAPVPEPTMSEFAPEAPTPSPGTPPQEEAKGRLGKLKGKLKFGRKKAQAPVEPLPGATPDAAEPAAEEKKGRFKGLFGKKKADEEPAPADAAVPPKPSGEATRRPTAAAETTGTPTEPTADSEAAEKDEGGRFSRLKKLRFRKDKSE